MSKSTLIKLGILAAATLAAKSTYSAMRRRYASTTEKTPSAESASPRWSKPTPAAGKPADAFSEDSIQHDLSIGDAV
ncbi:MAG: hypothetical protein JWL63_3326 [Rhodocyclales bacterium]|nr:hypothetical protein [Rhodocyclales bacterium]